jgi:ribose transport system permease protein
VNIQSFKSKLTQSSFFSSLMVFIILVIINAFLQPNFFSLNIIQSNITTFTPLILLAMAQAVVLIVGEIDLSLGASVTLINVIIASLMKDSGVSIIQALLCGMVIALFMGLINGFIVGFLKLPALVATFATSAVWFGISLTIMPQPGGYVSPKFYRLYLQKIGIIPVPLLIIIAAFLIWGIVRHTRLHRYIYAVGGNKEASHASGINVKIIKTAAFMLASLFTTIAAYVVTAQAASGDANIGQPFALSSIAAVIIGGVSLYGGRGSLIGAMLGASSLSILNNIIFFANIPSLYQDLIKGLIIIFSLALALLSGIRKANTIRMCH